MNRMRIAGFGIGSFCLLACLVGGFLIPSYVFIINNCTFKFDHYCAKLSQQSIREFGQETFINKPFQKISVELLKEKFPFIDIISVVYRAGGKLVCSLKSLHPLLKINDKKLMTSDGQIFDLVFFDPEMVHQIPSITVKDTSNVCFSNIFIESLKTLPIDFFNLFSLTWLDHTYVEFHDKKDVQFVMIAHYQTEFNARLINNYERIKKEIMKQRSYAKKQWNIDVRFKNQIIVGQRAMGDS